MTAAWGEPRPAEHHQCNSAGGSQAGTPPIPPPSHRARRTCCLWSRRRLCRWQPGGCEGCERRRTRAAAPGRNPGASCAAARRPRPGGPRPPGRCAWPSAGRGGKPPAAPAPAAPRSAASRRPPRPRRPPARPQSWAAPAHRPPSLPGQRAPARDTPARGPAPDPAPPALHWPPARAGPAPARLAPRRRIGTRARPAQSPTARARRSRERRLGPQCACASTAPTFPLLSRPPPHTPPSARPGGVGGSGGGGARGRSRRRLTAEGGSRRERLRAGGGAIAGGARPCLSPGKGSKAGAVRSPRCGHVVQRPLGSCWASDTSACAGLWGGGAALSGGAGPGCEAEEAKPLEAAQGAAWCTSLIRVNVTFPLWLSENRVVANRRLLHWDHLPCWEVYRWQHIDGSRIPRYVLPVLLGSEFAQLPRRKTL